MKIRNDERLLVEAVAGFADRRGLQLTRLSHDWLLVLNDGTRSHSVFGYDIGLNSATTLRVCNDKAASFDVLRAAGVPMIEHRLFLDPIMHRFTGLPGNWSGMLQAFDDFGRDVVVKANEGTSGNDVHRVRQPAELERVVHLLLTANRSIAISPFVALGAEKRFVILDDKIVLAYAKARPGHVADGILSVREMAARSMSPDTAEGMGEWLTEQTQESLDRVPDAGDIISFGWRHNLGFGASAERIDITDAAHADAAQLALRAAEATGLRFGSVDVAEREDSVQPLIMEVNAGVMLEHFGRQSTEAREAAIDIYHAALRRLFPDA